MIDKISILTPTGDRPEALALLRRWMETQTRKPDQWLIIDDGKAPVNSDEFPGATVIHRLLQADDPPCTLGRNLELALSRVAHDKIIIMEDDDWYAPEYIETLAALLDEHELAGIWGTNYYDPRIPGYREMGRSDHASLSQTAFRKSFIPEVLKACEGDCSVDFRIWFVLAGKTRGHLIPGEGRQLHCSIKGMPGRPGAGCGHDRINYTVDPVLVKFREWCGDVEAYRDYLACELGSPINRQGRIVVYTAIAGGDRDTLVDPPRTLGVDYVCFTDQPFTSKVWDVRPFSWIDRENVRTAKHPKVLPHRYFPDHEMSVWIDGNILPGNDDIIKLVNGYLADSDMALHRHPDRDCIYEEAEVVIHFKQDYPHLVKQMVDRYKAAGVPKSNGLYNCGRIIRRHHAPEIKEAMELWWREIVTGSSSDQFSLSYVLWKTGVTPKIIEGDLRNHPSFIFNPHPTIYWGRGEGEKATRQVNYHKPVML